jgi:mannose-6-phosphate isomerase-like protein (cupin superfamily)
MKKVIFQDVIKKVQEIWEPYDAGFINETALRVAKVEGPYNWHTHPGEDEFFMVLKGKVFIDTNAEDGTIELNELEGYVVKRGIRHRSRTEPGKPAWLLLVEPTRTKTKG